MEGLFGLKFLKALENCCGPGSSAVTIAEADNAPPPPQSNGVVLLRKTAVFSSSQSAGEDGYKLTNVSRSPATPPLPPPHSRSPANQWHKPASSPQRSSHATEEPQRHHEGNGAPVRNAVPSPAGAATAGRNPVPALDTGELPFSPFAKPAGADPRYNPSPPADVVESPLRLAGVGIIFRTGANDEGLYVDALLPECPIHTKTTVKPGMRLVRVAGRDVAYASQVDIAPLILGPLGSFVDLQFERQGRRPSMETTWRYRRGSMSQFHVQVERFHEIKLNPAPRQI